MTVNGTEIAIGSAQIRFIIKVHMSGVDEKIFSRLIIDNIKVAVSVADRTVYDTFDIGDNDKISVFIGCDGSANKRQSVITCSRYSVRHNRGCTGNIGRGDNIALSVLDCIGQLIAEYGLFRSAQKKVDGLGQGRCAVRNGVSDCGVAASKEGNKPVVNGSDRRVGA